MEEGSSLAESSGRKMRHCSEHRSEIGGDRLSCLPDSLLLHILSFLDAKVAGKTSILSRRWRHLWTHTDTLNFSGQYYVESEKELGGVDRCLLLHQGSKVKRFQLCWSFRKRYASHFDAWIRFAMRKGVEELNVELSSIDNPYRTHELPRWIFKCGSLRLLKLTFCDIKFPGSVDLPLLRTLSLCYISLSGDLIHELLAGCPLLEDLDIEMCDCLNSLCISSNIKLKRLVIHTIYLHRLEIDAPNLLLLKISKIEVSKDNYFLKNLSSLIYAELGLGFSFHWGKDMRDHYILEELLKGLRHAKVLTLNPSFIQVVSTWELRKVPAPLSERKCLTLCTGLQNWELPGIASLLRSSPDLETLIVQISVHDTFVLYRYNIRGEEFNEAYNFSEREYWESHEYPFPCLAYHLKNVTIVGFMGEGPIIRCGSDEVMDFLTCHDGGTNLVKFLLKNAMVLEKMKIYIGGRQLNCRETDDWELVSRKKQEILTSPRASSRLQVYFS